MSPPRRRLPGAPLLLLALLLPPGCRGLATAPRGEEREIILSTAWDDQRAGREEAEEAEAEFGVVEDAELGAYVEAVGRRLARHAPGYRFDYAFRIADQEVPNAFALPGGHVFVSRGLLVLANSEDELANVLGHEIIHVARRHAAARQTVVQGLPALLQLVQIGSLAAYGRGQEAEADRLGQGLAALAGYDPAGLARFLRDLELSERLRLGSSRTPGFLDTHPSTTGRAAAAAERAGRIAWQRSPGVARSSADYLRRIEGLAVGTPASEGVFQGSRFVHPDLGFTIRFPEGWETHNTRRAVGAISPRRDALVFLEHRGEGSDPEEAARRELAELEEDGLRVRSAQPVRIGPQRALRVEGSAGTPAGRSQVVVTWIARGGEIYRLTGLAAGDRQGVFLAVARSFRTATPELAGAVSETRLQIAEARAGESLRALSERTGNQWSLEETAVMNDLFADALLEPRQLVKVAVSERYRPRTTRAGGGRRPDR